MKFVLSVIDSLRQGWYNPPTIYYTKREEFEQISYRHSALNEIKFYLMEHENEDPITEIEKFRRRMDEFSSNGKTKSSKFMFSVYYDVATDVLDVLLGMK